MSSSQKQEGGRGPLATEAQTIGVPSAEVAERWERDKEAMRKRLQVEHDLRETAEALAPPPYWLVFPGMIAVAAIFLLVAKYVFHAF